MKYLAVFLGLFACNFTGEPVQQTTSADAVTVSMTTDSLVPPQYDSNKRLIKVTKSNEAWKKQLNDLEYNVLRQEGTERAFTGDLWNNHEKGTYTCAACCDQVRVGHRVAFFLETVET
jgi:hypothetical protein